MKVIPKYVSTCKDNQVEENKKMASSYWQRKDEK